MNATVQNPHHKCDLGNENDSVTDKEITADNVWLIIIITIIILRLIFVFVRYTSSSTRWEVQC